MSMSKTKETFRLIKQSEALLAPINISKDASSHGEGTFATESIKKGTVLQFDTALVFLVPDVEVQLPMQQSLVTDQVTGLLQEVSNLVYLVTKWQDKLESSGILDGLYPNTLNQVGKGKLFLTASKFVRSSRSRVDIALMMCRIAYNHTGGDKFFILSKQQSKINHHHQPNIQLFPMIESLPTVDAPIELLIKGISTEDIISHQELSIDYADIASRDMMFSREYKLENIHRFHLLLHWDISCTCQRCETKPFRMDNSMSAEDARSLVFTRAVQLVKDMSPERFWSLYEG